MKVPKDVPIYKKLPHCFPIMCCSCASLKITGTGILASKEMHDEFFDKSSNCYDLSKNIAKKLKENL